MPFSFDKIISSDDVLIDVPAILELLEQKSELWLFDNNKPQFVIVRPDEASITNAISTEDGKSEAPKMKIGKFVQETFRKLLYASILPLDELTRLTSPEYSKSHFNLNFSVLKEYNPKQTLDSQKRDDKGYNRYYDYLLFAYNKQYLLSSQWVENLHRGKFQQWLMQWVPNIDEVL